MSASRVENRGEKTDIMRKKYHNCDEMVHRMNQPGSLSIRVLSEESGVPKATLYAWLYNDRRLRAQQSSEPKEPLAMTKRIRPRSPSVKLELVADSRLLQGAEFETFCHRNGVTVGELLSWRDLALSGIELADRDGLGATRKEHDDEMTRLKSDLRRKNDVLAEAAALLILQKKLWAYWAEKSDGKNARPNHYRDRCGRHFRRSFVHGLRSH